MNWFLITNTKNRNPGDEYVRIGVQRLIATVDLEPNYILINKEEPAEYQNLTPNGKVIWCGSPLWWSNSGQNCWECPWWQAVFNGPLLADKQRVLILGAGTCLGESVRDPQGLSAAVDYTLTKAWRIIARDPIWLRPAITIDLCPSVFCLLDSHQLKSRKLCNLMPQGSHYDIMNQTQAEHWRKMLPDVAAVLIEEGFEFVAHDQIEYDLARALHWPANRLIPRPETAEGYLPVYGGASHYFGNRLHGAMLALSGGAKTWAVGYDSRLLMVHLALGKNTLPSEVNVEQIKQWSQMNEENELLWLRNQYYQSSFSRQQIVVREFYQLQ